MVHRVAIATGQDPAKVYRQPYTWTLYSFLQLGLIERQEEARRAVENEELVNGIAYAFHEPGKISGWSADLRQRVGLLVKPKADRVGIARLSKRLEQGIVTPIAPAPET